MTVIHGHTCDACGALDRTHPDDGAPADWYLLARMARNGGWDEAEWHACSGGCLLAVAAKAVAG